MSIQEKCIEKYAELKHLKLVGIELGIPWQTVYVYLKEAGVAVTGDKARYGSVTDRLAVYAENLFAESVPFATDNNAGKFQATVDFDIEGMLVDVKASMLQPGRHDASGKKIAPRWAYCISKQKDISDFFVLYAFSGDAEAPKQEHVFLLPTEIATARTSISIPLTLRSKWADYEVKEGELADFFKEMKKIKRSAA